MGKITLTLSEKLEKKIRTEAAKRNIPMNRLISQVLKSDSMKVLNEVQYLRQEIFKLRTKSIVIKERRDDTAI